MTKYKVVDNHPKAFHENHAAIKILDGPLEGVVYQYDTVGFNEEDATDDGAILEFNTLELENPNRFDLTTKENGAIIGDILVEIIEHSLKELEQNELDGNSNT